MSGKRQFGTVRKLPSRKVAGAVSRWARPDVLRAVNLSNQDRRDPFPRGGGSRHGTRAVHRSPLLDE